ncbi:MAG: PDZ domain-containing protein, partial [Pseudomonadota bacterium]|nr:PDZ domain-containing protein [Pseudomonadota bacterium]
PRGSPAARSGFRPGDLLVSVNDRKIARVSDVKRILGGRPAGWVIAIRRNGKVLTGEFEG